LFNIDTEYIEKFSYDILKLIQDPAFARSGGTLEELHYPTNLRVTHNDGQRATITRELAFYGSDIGGLTMLISRYPIKRFWRKATYVDGFVPLPKAMVRTQAANV
jgi:hypothetical protein